MTKAQTIYQDLKQRISSGDLAVGERLPTEKEMAQRYGVALLTIRQALGWLRKDGLVESRRYHGTVVISPSASEAKKKMATPPLTVGLVIPESLKSLSHPVFSRLVDGIEGVLTQNGYALKVVISNPANAAAEANFSRVVASSEARGWLIPSVISDASKKVMREKSEPKILFHFSDDAVSQHFFETDYRELHMATLQHLQKEGYRHIWAIGPKLIRSWESVLIESAQSEVFAGKIRVRTRETKNFSAETAESVCRQILKTEKVDAFICADDELCVGALSALVKTGLSCPQVGVVGAGDFPLSSLAKPALTTVSYPYFQVGREATQLLLDLIQGQTVEPARRLFVPKLIVRESTKLSGLCGKAQSTTGYNTP